MLLLTLPGTAFVYQGDEIGMADGPGGEPPVDRFGRDRHRHPMQWEPTPERRLHHRASPGCRAWTPRRAQRRRPAPRPGLVLSLYRRLIALRRELSGPLELLEAAPELVAFPRGEHLVAVNAGERPAAAPAHGEVLVATGRPSRAI